MIRALFKSALIAASIGVAACTDSTGPATLTPCTGQVTVAVARTSNGPVISWSPACGLNDLQVSSMSLPDNIAVAWQIHSYGKLFGPPVRYGVNPDTGVVAFSPRELTAGVAYEFDVVRADSLVRSWGATTFSP